MSSRRPARLPRCTASVAVGAALVAVAGCSNSERLAETFYGRRDFAAAAALERPAADAPGKDRLLALNEYATSALCAGDLESARRGFLDGWSALRTEQGSGWRNALALAGGESLKVYRGDPYERAMVSIMAGLLLYEAGDYENARAAFKNAALEDSGSKDEAFNADFALAYLFEGLCARRLGDEVDAALLFRAALRSRAGQRDTPFLRGIDRWRPNLAIVLGIGHGPRKIGIGVFDELATFVPVPSHEDFALVTIDGKPAGRTHEIEDLYYQAVTRGGREMDDFLRTKAAVKTTIRTTGAVLVAVGLAMAAAATNNDQRTTAGVVILAGAAFFAISWCITPEADTRHWETLPGKIHVFLAEMPPGSHSVNLDFFDSAGRPLPELRQMWHHVPVHRDRDTLLLMRSISDPAAPPAGA